MKRSDVIGPMRPAFLILPPVSVALGAGTALWTGHSINPVHLVLVLVGAMAAHAAANVVNEYYDFRSGLDLTVERTPFSGGTGTLPSRPEAAPTVLGTGIVLMATTAAVGVYFLSVRGWALLPLGLLGLIDIVVYTPWLTHSVLGSLLAPGLGVGLLMVMGTDFCLTGTYSWSAFFASLMPFFLVSNLLVLNQFPDIEPDRAIGRRHLLVVHGPRIGAYVYAGMLAGTYLSIIVGWIVGALPAWTLLGLLTVPLSVRTSLGAYRYGSDIERLMPYMAQNVLISFLTPLLAAIGLFLAIWL
ncbi:MAG: prenyltransferase [Anaerolineae bacterium]|jgi:1,4-dihydroxy-2-naphthoate polyprenyltransferase